MNAFFFGPSSRALYGAFTHRNPGPNESTAVLLCYPLGVEYMRAHRAFRQLTTLLVRAGCDVLRFDYSCTGDSWGAGEDASVPSWLDDIDWAIDELKDNAAARRVTIVGLRWGATLAALATRERTDIDHLVLWDPVVSGRTYLDREIGPGVRPTETVGIHGFPMTHALASELDPIDLANGEPPPVATGPDTVSLVVAEERPEYHHLRDRLVEAGRNTDFEIVPSSGDWSQADPFGDALIPQQIIGTIVERVTTRQRR